MALGWIRQCPTIVIGAQIDLGAMEADCVRMFKRIEDLSGVTVARYRKTGYINA